MLSSYNGSVTTVVDDFDDGAVVAAIVTPSDTVQTFANGARTPAAATAWGQARSSSCSDDLYRRYGGHLHRACFRMSSRWATAACAIVGLSRTLSQHRVVGS